MKVEQNPGRREYGLGSLDSAPQKRLRPSALDLFSGCGGLSVGLRKAGFEVLGAIEVDETAAKTYRLNHPTTHVWQEDIQTLNPNDVLMQLEMVPGDLDLLAGCPPCQGFSTMRTRNGRKSVKDPRNHLLMEFLRYVEMLRPKAVMMENVPRLAKYWRFIHFRSRMKALGYKGHFKVLDAANYGVPQRRKRLIYMASRIAIPQFAEEQTRQKTVRNAIGGLPMAGNSGDVVHDLPEQRSERVLKLIRQIPKDGGSRVSLPKEMQLKCHSTCDGFKDVYGRMAWDDLAPTITSGCFNPSKGRFLHPTADRAITIREAALLQGFPKSYKFSSTRNKSTLALMIGNALPPPFIKAHAQKIYDVLTSTAIQNQRKSNNKKS